MLLVVDNRSQRVDLALDLLLLIGAGLRSGAFVQAKPGSDLGFDPASG